jgi:hypothetical protein
MIGTCKSNQISLGGKTMKEGVPCVDVSVIDVYFPCRQPALEQSIGSGTWLKEMSTFILLNGAWRQGQGNELHGTFISNSMAITAAVIPPTEG